MKEEESVHEEDPPLKEELVKEEEYVKEEWSAEDEEFEDGEEAMKEEHSIKEERHIQELQEIKEEAFINEDDHGLKAEGDIKPFAHGSPENYLFQVRLRGTSDPTISRLLSVPSNYTFERFHEVLQIALGWANYHMYIFIISKIPQNGEVSCDRCPAVPLRFPNLFPGARY
jgi:hypothetical protein